VRSGAFCGRLPFLLVAFCDCVLKIVKYVPELAFCVPRSEETKDQSIASIGIGRNQKWQSATTGACTNLHMHAGTGNGVPWLTAEHTKVPKNRKHSILRALQHSSCHLSDLRLSLSLEARVPSCVLLSTQLLPN
jgi:hypothetical protein